MKKLELFEIRENEDKGGPAHLYRCRSCGWEGGPLELDSGVVSVTESTEAISSRICPNCGKSESSI